MKARSSGHMTRFGQSDVLSRTLTPELHIERGNSWTLSTVQKCTDHFFLRLAIVPLLNSTRTLSSCLFGSPILQHFQFNSLSL